MRLYPVNLLLLVCVTVISIKATYAIPPLPSTKESREAEQEAARQWLIEEKAFSAEYTNYYNYHDNINQTISVAGGQTEHFICTLQVDKTNGDCLILVEGKGKKKVELNLTYNFVDSEEEYRAYLLADKPNSVNKNIERPQQKLLDKHTCDDTRLFTRKRRGIIYLYSGEMYVKRDKIWDMAVWDNLVREAEKQREGNFRLQYGLTLKVEDTFYSAKARCVLPGKAVIMLNNLKIAQEKKAAAQPPNKEPLDRQMRVTIERGEKGEPIMRLQPVKTGAEK